MNVSIRIINVLLIFVILFIVIPCRAQIDRFLPKQGGTTEIWRITNDPNMREHSNYHNVNCWSPDGRYICYVRYEPYETQRSSEVYIYDLHEDKATRIDNGSSPRWGRKHNWLFYIKRNPEGGDPNEKGTQLMWLDVETNKLTRIAYGVPSIGEADSDDRWMYGYKSWGRGKRQGVRVPIRPDSRVEVLEGLHGAQWIANPVYPIVFSRHDHGDPNATDRPFEATRYWCNLEGKNITIASPMIQRCHQSWSGDGKYHLHGNTPISGRLWNKPFPSNLHFLSAIGCGDVSSCGKSGRWICGSGNQGPLQIVDLWSGDGYNYLKAALSFIHDSDKYGYSFGSGLEDNDSKGSADGTKILFVSNYDLKNGPITEVTENVSGATGDRIPVKSTEGFPESGRLSAGNEVIGYARKTPTSFEGLTRRLYHTTSTNLEYLSPQVKKEYEERKSDEEFIKKRGISILNKMRALYSKQAPDISEGLRISSFEHRFIPEGKRKKMSSTSRFVQPDFPGYKNSPLMWQARTDVYIAVVRFPDQPHLRKIDDEVELIPGENHWETFGYHIFKGGKKITNEPLRPGSTFTLPEAGTYTAAAVEWSGLKSLHSFHIQIEKPEKLRIRYDKPADFFWIAERYLVDEKEVSEEEAKRSVKAVKEIVHLIEGVIHHEWYNWGQITKRFDLNSEKKPIRRLFYQNSKLVRREYHNRDGFHVSTEFFDTDGYITETIQYRMVDGKSQEHSHYWYERGMPVKHIGNSVRHSAPLGSGTYVKEGDRWVKKD